jgi:hypothetical protein
MVVIFDGASSNGLCFVMLLMEKLLEHSFENYL